MNKEDKIYIAGHRGLVGSAILRKLKEEGYTNIITKTHKELDLTRQKEVEDFFEKERPDYVFLAAARVGGILANNTYKAEFIYDNIMIAANIINSAYKYNTRKLLNLGSSCIYPKYAPQPMKEEYLLTGALEPTNEPYAIAKISAIKLARYYNEQYNTNFISVMPTNLYGPNDKFHLYNSHVLPALIRKFHLAKLLVQKDYETIKKDLILNKDNILKTDNIEIEITEKSDKNDIQTLLSYYGIRDNPPTVTLWGTGDPYREFLYVDDLADAVFYLMKNYNYKDIGEFVNIGTGKDITIKDLAYLIKDIVQYEEDITFDPSKPDGTPRKLLNISRITSLGWKPKVSLREGIEKTYKWYVRRLLGRA